MAVSSRKVVLGLGNILNRDEGLGVHAVKALEVYLSDQNGRLVPEGVVEFLDGGTLGLNLLPIVEESSHLLILDAVNTNQPSGTVIELGREQIPLYAGIQLSEHQVGFQEVLGLASFRARLPQHLHLIGAQPADIGIGLELSPKVADALPSLVRRAASLLQEWGLLDGSLVVGSERILGM